MTITDVCTIAGTAVTVGGALVYMGRQTGTLKMIATGQEVLFRKDEEKAKEISGIKERVTAVETRQSDCENCP